MLLKIVLFTLHNCYGNPSAKSKRCRDHDSGSWSFHAERSWRLFAIAHCPSPKTFSVCPVCPQASRLFCATDLCLSSPCHICAVLQLPLEVYGVRTTYPGDTSRGSSTRSRKKTEGLVLCLLLSPEKYIARDIGRLFQMMLVFTFRKTLLLSSRESSKNSRWCPTLYISSILLCLFHSPLSLLSSAARLLFYRLFPPLLPFC